MNTIDTNFIPYLLGTFYSWTVNNKYHPLIEVEYSKKNQVPDQNPGDIVVLNIHPEATRNANFGKDSMSFVAMFDGVSKNVKVSYDSILKIYTKEDNIVINFDELIIDTHLSVVK